MGSCHNDHCGLWWYEVIYFHSSFLFIYSSSLIPICLSILTRFRCGAFFERGVFCRSRLRKFLLQEYSRCFLVGCSHYDNSRLWWHDVRNFLVSLWLSLFIYPQLVSTFILILFTNLSLVYFVFYSNIIFCGVTSTCFVNIFVLSLSRFNVKIQIVSTKLQINHLFHFSEFDMKFFKVNFLKRSHTFFITYIISLLFFLSVLFFFLFITNSTTSRFLLLTATVIII